MPKRNSHNQFDPKAIRYFERALRQLEKRRDEILGGHRQAQPAAPNHRACAFCKAVEEVYRDPIRSIDRILGKAGSEHLFPHRKRLPEPQGERVPVKR